MIQRLRLNRLSADGREFRLKGFALGLIKRINQICIGEHVRLKLYGKRKKML